MRRADYGEVASGGSLGKIEFGPGKDHVHDEPEQDALFQIEGPDEDGCVWACSAEGRDVWCQNLGPKEKVVEVFSEWLEPLQVCVGLTLSREQSERLDGWIAEQEGDKPTRPEAIRRLLDLLLAE